MKEKILPKYWIQTSDFLFWLSHTELRKAKFVLFVRPNAWISYYYRVPALKVVNRVGYVYKETDGLEWERYFHSLGNGSY